MNDIQLVVTDVDGTLVEPQQHEVSEKVRSAVLAAEKQGIKVVPVTGRPYEMVQPVLLTLGFDSLCVVDNGATIREAVSGKLVWSEWLDVETIRQVVAIFLPFSTAMDYSPEWNDHIPDAATEMSLIHSPAPYVFSFVPNDKVDIVEAELRKLTGIAYHFDAHTTDPNMSATQVTSSKATKYYGVEELRKLLGAKKEHTLAIGDGNNDLPLFENARLKIAMGNATDLLKAKADHEVGPVADDGFAEAMNKFVL